MELLLERRRTTGAGIDTFDRAHDVLHANDKIVRIHP
jgi:hypothetical protein